MKLLLLGIFVFFFVVVPMFLLDHMVMPAIDSLQNTYAHADVMAQQIANPTR